MWASCQTSVIRGNATPSIGVQDTPGSGQQTSQMICDSHPAWIPDFSNGDTPEK